MSRYLLLGAFFALRCLSLTLTCTVLTVDILALSRGDNNAFLAKIMLCCSTLGACLGRCSHKGVLSATS